MQWLNSGPCETGPVNAPSVYGALPRLWDRSRTIVLDDWISTQDSLMGWNWTGEVYKGFHRLTLPKKPVISYRFSIIGIPLLGISLLFKYSKSLSINSRSATGMNSLLPIMFSLKYNFRCIFWLMYSKS